MYAIIATGGKQYRVGRQHQDRENRRRGWFCSNF